MRGCVMTRVLAASDRTEEQAATARDRRRRDVTRLYLQGLTQAEIARRVGVSQQQVSRDLEAVRDEWRADTRADAAALRAREVAKLDAVEASYWVAWEESRGVQVRRTREQSAHDGTEDARTIEVSEESPGDPRYLAGVLACIDRRCRLLGLDVPPQHEVAVAPVKVVSGVDLDAL
jgi:transcriptional regulator with XRE-family HTH domain